MNGKELILDFINYALLILLIGFCVIYFTIPGNFDAFQALMKALAPLAFFAFVFLIRISRSRRIIRERKEQNSMEIMLCLSYFDKYKYELATILLPIMILLLSLPTGKPDYIDVIQASLAYLFMLVMGRYLFKKQV